MSLSVKWCFSAAATWTDPMLRFQFFSSGDRTILAGCGAATTVYLDINRYHLLGPGVRSRGVIMKLLLESIADGAPPPRAGRVQESIGVRRRREADDGSQGIVRGGGAITESW